MSLIEIRDLSKNHGGLRPFRLQSLDIDAGEAVVVSGPDQQAAAVLTDLVTGTVLPDAGIVRVAGRSTADLVGHDDWLAFLEQFGLVNDRVVLLDDLSVAANLALPLTLDLDPLPRDVEREVGALAVEIGIDAESLARPLARASAWLRWLVCLGRAVVHRPAIVILEHPSVALEDDAQVANAARTARRVTVSRGMASLIVSADNRFNTIAATRRLAWQAASGRTTEVRGWRRWFS
jgi:ABC-type transporter Mla maintaining outer membrane lipid asymmetry ATPase subunit MlaF